MVDIVDVVAVLYVSIIIITMMLWLILSLMFMLVYDNHYYDRDGVLDIVINIAVCICQSS